MFFPLLIKGFIIFAQEIFTLIKFPMKKIILAIIIIPVVIVLITIIAPKKSLSHRDMEGLRGNVKCMEQKTYFFDSEQQNFESLIRTDNLAEDEEVSDVESVGLYRMLGFMNFSENYKVCFTPEGKVSEKEDFYKNNYFTKLRFEYNSKGFLVKTKVKTSRQTYILVFEEPTAEGLVHYQKFQEGKLPERKLLIYEKGLITRIFPAESIQYDKKGHIKELITYENDSIPSDSDPIFRYSYNSKGQLSRISFYFGEYLAGELNAFYDKIGNISHRKDNGVINSGEKTYKYKFDKEGNWIERTTFKDGTPWVLSIRNIEYY